MVCGSVGTMDPNLHVEFFPVNLARFAGVGLRFRRLRVRPAWLVHQTKVSGAMNQEVLIYAEVFYRRSSAEKAQIAANSGLPTLGKYTFGSRRWAHLVKMPSR